MKNKFFTLTLSLFIVLNGCSNLSHFKVEKEIESEPFKQGSEWTPLERLNDGFMQMLTGLIEPANQIGKEIAKRRNPITGFIPGVVKGVGWLVAREVVGIFEIVTFFLPSRPHLKPIDTTWLPPPNEF